MPHLEPCSRVTDPVGGWGWVGFGLFASAIFVVYAWATLQPAVTIIDYLLAPPVLLPCTDLLFAWWRVGPRLPHSAAATVLWALLLLACPPLLSLDVNAYLTQGQMVLGGHDPCVMTLGGPQPPGIVAGVDQVNTTSVYPVGSLLVFAVMFWAGGGPPWLRLLLFRALHPTYLLAVAWVVKCLAPRVGVPMNTALWAGVTTPLLVSQWTGGLYSDAVLVTLIVLAMLVVQYDGWTGLLLGRALIGLSLTVKQPGMAAGPGVAALAWAASPGQDWWRSAGQVAAVEVVAAAVSVGVSWGSGLGFGWNNPTAGSPLAVMSDLSLSWVIQVMRFFGQEASLISVARVLTFVAGLTVLTAWVWLVVRFGPRPGEPGRPRVVLLGGLLAFALLGPTLQPWHFTWVVPLIALALPGRRWQQIWLGAAMVIMMATATQAPFGSPLLCLATRLSWRSSEAKDLDVSEERAGI